MKRVAIIPIDKIDLLTSKNRPDGPLFSPIEDSNGNIVISENEVLSCTTLEENHELYFVGTLQLIEFQEKERII